MPIELQREGGTVRFRPRRFQTFSAAILAACFCALSSVAGVLADIPATRIVVEPPIVHPGDEVSIHGAYLWTDAHVVVSITGRAGASRTIGSATTFGDGSLEMRALIPSDMPEGRFRVVVTNETGEFVDVELVIDPPFPVIPALAVFGGGTVALIVATLIWRRRHAEDALAGT